MFLQVSCTFPILAPSYITLVKKHIDFSPALQHNVCDNAGFPKVLEVTLVHDIHSHVPDPQQCNVHGILKTFLTFIGFNVILLLHLLLDCTISRKRNDILT